MLFKEFARVVAKSSMKIFHLPRMSVIGSHFENSIFHLFASLCRIQTRQREPTASNNRCQRYRETHVDDPRKGIRVLFRFEDTAFHARVNEKFQSSIDRKKAMDSLANHRLHFELANKPVQIYGPISMTMKIVSRTVLIGLFYLSAVHATDAADWAQFRGPKGQGISTDKGVPTAWSATSNIAWKTPLPGAGTSSPIVVGEKIFLTCYSGHTAPGVLAGTGENLQRHVVCLDRSSGKIVWSKEVPSKLPEETRTRDEHGWASNTPVADAERLYVFFGKSGVFAFDHQGKQLWHKDVGSKTNGWGSAASPILHGNLLIVNASVESDAIYAFDKKTGAEKWRIPGIREAWNTPVLVSVKGGGTELVVPIPQKVLAFDANTGKPLWSCGTEIGWYMVPSSAVHEGIVYVTGGRSGKIGTLAIRAGGRGDVTRTHRLWTTEKRSNVTSPIYHDGHVYFGQDNLGIIYCLNAKTGDVVFEERVPGRGDQIYASPVLADGKIYFVLRQSGTLVIEASPKFTPIATNTLETRTNFHASPVVHNSQILLRSDRFLYCIGEK